MWNSGFVKYIIKTGYKYLAVKDSSLCLNTLVLSWMNCLYTAYLWDSSARSIILTLCIWKYCFPACLLSNEMPWYSKGFFTSQNSYESEIKMEDDVKFLLSVTWRKCIFKFCLHQAFIFLFSVFTLGKKIVFFQCHSHAIAIQCHRHGNALALFFHG